MKVYIYLDESGHIHKNAHTQYFAIGSSALFRKETVK
jgi:hypothetical protein